MEQVGYGDFCTDSPEKAAELMCKQLLLRRLRDVVIERIDYDKALTKSVKVFVKVIRNEAAFCQAYAPEKSADNKNPTFTDTEGSSSSDKGKLTDNKEQLPVCFYPAHKEKGLRHLLRDCRSCPEDKNGPNRRA